MKKKELSIIIPTYNRAELIEKTAQQICAMVPSHLDVEIIIVDDGSQDNTSYVLKKLCERHKNIIVERKDNGGPGSARNIGAELSNSNLILFMGDDTVPANNFFFSSHIEAHKRIRNSAKVVLGKIKWPKNYGRNLNLLEYLIQGDGQQQFGFKYMEPWKEYDWRFFYTANISMHKSLVQDWNKGGFDKSFYKAAFEDGELAYRLSKDHKDFGIVYVPTCVVEHDHAYTVNDFIRRQINCGAMADILFKLHPELRAKILPDYFVEKLDSAKFSATNYEKMLNVVNGLFAYAELLSENEILGTSNWHEGFINIVMDVAFLYGYIITQTDLNKNYSAALWSAINISYERASILMQQELLGKNYG